MKNFSKTHRLNMSLSAKKRCASPQWKKLRESWFTPVDIEIVKKLYYEKGLTQTETAKAIGVSVRVIERFMIRHNLSRRQAKIRPSIVGSKHPLWKGASVTYKTFHKRLYKTLGQPKKCSVCGTTKSKIFDWANLTGKFNDPNDYKRMCRSCHFKHDGMNKNFK